ncbi:U3 small nucleolar RNA-associated protein 4 [Hirsutella rhossiliensis]|uniref:U3 small nucleolar RNA-associated protein 4 n=1 Tax=Hirsutella rhossiliensis TaxID=111463 RepID=A0A9P8MVK9_9HYPO|nr:U3 small nucleolar RNA-associated protein 4 [Hirsutella rhossiliensis]KAH0962207.1 U3 small nucleolar RNA-associated protein 4 [Hirsutella rhossiliensis]
MDIHRCRFVPYQPSAINAVAFSHPQAKSSLHRSIARLAVGRASGDIEIWNPSSGIWHQELVIRGGKDRSVDGLVWINEPDQDLGGGRTLIGKSRLFSIGYTSTVTEWDLEKAKPLKHASGQHGDVWCLAAQPPDEAGSETQASNKLIAGTIDGELAIYSVEDNDLRFQRLLVRSPTKKAQMVSITFQSRKVVIVGCSDSTIRAYDVGRGHMLRRMTLGSDLVGGAKNIIVWSVKCLPNGNIVSGDSTGQICIWDGKTLTQAQRIQSHKQDVLSLAISGDGSSIMSGGMDRRTFLYKQNAGEGQRWSKAWGRRYHDHDVKSMAAFESGRMSVVVSGGPDANLMIVPLKEMGRENHRTMSSLPQQPPMASAPGARFMVSWWDRQVHIWVFKKPATELFDSTGDGIDLNQNRKLLKSIVIKGDSNITSATVSRDGMLLVVSTAIDVKAFRLKHEDPAKPSDVNVASAELPQKLTHLGASLVKLSPNGRWLCLVQEGSRVLIADMQSSHEAPDSTIQLQRMNRLRREIPRHITNGGLGRYDRSITQADFSPDSEMLAVADLAGYIDTWILRGPREGPKNGNGSGGGDDAASSDSDSEEEEAASDADKRWIRNPNAKLIPKLPSAPVVLSFSDSITERVVLPGTLDLGGDASGDYVLAAITSNWHITAFHPRHASLTAWARRHPRMYLPAAIQDLLDLPKGIVWQGSRVWVYGVSFLFMLDMSQDLRKSTMDGDAPADSQVTHGTKRKRTGLTTGAGGVNEKENLTPHKVRKHGDDEQYEDVDVGKASRGSESDGDDELPDAEGELSRLRNGNAEAGESVEEVGTCAERKKWWITYKYRPILGMVPLNTADQPLEVALVERPTWEMEMPERYLVGDERDR